MLVVILSTKRKENNPIFFTRLIFTDRGSRDELSGQTRTRITATAYALSSSQTAPQHNPVLTHFTTVPPLCELD
jgi:hypothetical protein